MARKNKTQTTENQVGTTAATKPARWLSPNTLIPLIGLTFLTVIAFFPVLDAEFVNWDDDKNFSENVLITGLNSENFWSNVKQIFVTPVIGNYNPLPIFTFAIEHQVFGLDQPIYWHLNNLLLHIGCVIFVFLIGQRLRLSLWATILFAGLFAIHPMRVESVAWVTERKDVLFGIFYLWGMWLYLKNIQGETKLWRTILITLLFVLSLFSKIQAVIFPVSLILLDYLEQGKLTLKQFYTKAHLFAGSIAFGMYGIKLLAEQGSLESTADYSDFQRIFIGSFSYLIYYIKALVPFKLSPLYPYPSDFPVSYYPSILSFVAGGGVMLWSYLKGWKHLCFGVTFFTANVFFLLQIKGAGQGFMADRFTYIAYLGLFYLMAFAYDRYLAKASNPIKYAAVIIPLLIYSIMTFTQSKVWKNSDTLWTHVLKYYTNTTLPYGNRANYYRDTGQTAKALQDYAKTISLKPQEAGPYNSRARLYFDSGKESDLPLALREYNLAIERVDTIAEYYANRGATYARLGQLQPALKDLNKAITLDPTFTNSFLNRSVIHRQLGNVQAAIKDLEAYMKNSAYQPDLWYELGAMYNRINDYKSGLQKLNRAVQLDNKKGIYFIERGKANFSLGNKAQAVSDINTATQLGADVPAKVKEVILGQ